MKRRQFLAGGAVATASGLAAAANSVPVATVEAAGRASVVLHDPRLPLDPVVMRRLEANGARIIALDDDPVRMWRSEIGTLLQQRDTRLFGMTRWADLLIVRGLAAESRRHLQYEYHDEARDCFTWLIA
ncbi:MAG: hypothetical protein ABI616_15125 [Pseudomonadota bacterium]